MPPTPQDPMEIYVDDSKLTLHGLQQHYVKLAENEKNRKLNELLDALEFNQVVIFVKSVQRAIQLDKLLQECNFPSVAIHASMKQEDRIKLYQSFKDVRRLADRAARAARAAAARLRRRPLSFAHSSSIAFSSPRTSGGAASTSSASIYYDMPDARSRSRSRACPRAEAHHLATFAHAGVGHVPAPRGARRPLRHQGPRYHVRLDRRGCEDPRGRAVSFRGVHHAPAGVDRCHVIHVRAPARLRSPPPPLPAPARLSVRVRASAHPRRQPPDTLIHPGRTA